MKRIDLFAWEYSKWTDNAILEDDLQYLQYLLRSILSNIFLWHWLKFSSLIFEHWHRDPDDEVSQHRVHLREPLSLQVNLCPKLPSETVLGPPGIPTSAMVQLNTYVCTLWLDTAVYKDTYTRFPHCNPLVHLLGWGWPESGGKEEAWGPENEKLIVYRK